MRQHLNLQILLIHQIRDICNVILLAREKGYSEDIEFSFVTISVTMPKEIVKTNGTLSADKKTATWDML